MSPPVCPIDDFLLLCEQRCRHPVVEIFTCDNSLRLCFDADLFVPLLPPYLIVVLHAARFIRFCLLSNVVRHERQLTNVSFTYPHLRFLEVLGAPIEECTFQRQHIAYT